MRTAVFLLLILLFASCRHARQKVVATPSSQSRIDSLYHHYLSLAKTLPVKVAMYRWAVFLGDTMICPDTLLCRAAIDSSYCEIGKIIDDQHVFAMTCINRLGHRDSADLHVFRYDTDHWQTIGEYAIPNYVLSMQDLNAGSGTGHDVLLSGARNMNGNQSQYFFLYKESTGQFKFAGEFFSSDYEIDTVHHLIRVVYEGSWYMDNTRALFVWHDDSLVPLREVRLSLIRKEMISDKNNELLTYSVNKDTSYSGGYRQVFSEIDKDNSPRHKKYWDGFFDLK